MIDVNAYLGHFAFRQLRHNTVRGLLGLMDKHKIDRACVSSAASITYRNAQSGNEEVAAEIRAHRDRFTHFAVLNPAYAGWRDDLKICQEQFGARGLRLYPRWHHYKLSDPECMELVRRAAEKKMVVSIPSAVEDRRQQSWLVDIPDVDREEIATLMRAVPAAHFILSASVPNPPPNFSVEISKLTAAMQNEIGQLLSTLGPERILFGSGMPFHYPDPALLKIEILEATAAVKQRIVHDNAHRLLNL